MAPSHRPPADAWTYLYAAITLDVATVFLLAGADGVRHPFPAGLAAVAFLAELWAFARALRSIESSVAYAFYGLSTAAVAAISIVALGEPTTPLKLAGLAMIVVGVIVLNSVGAKAPEFGGRRPPRLRSWRPWRRSPRTPALTPARYSTPPAITSPPGRRTTT
jgi:small multidrug resistance pump